MSRTETPPDAPRRKSLREGVGYASTLGLSLLLPFAQSIALQRYLSNEEFGVWTTVAAILGIVGSISVGFDRAQLLSTSASSTPDAVAEGLAPFWSWNIQRSAAVLAAWTIGAWFYFDGAIRWPALLAGGGLVFQLALVQPLVGVGIAVRQPLDVVLRAGLPRLALIAGVVLVAESIGHVSLSVFGVLYVVASLVSAITLALWAWRLVGGGLGSALRISWSRTRNYMKVGLPYAALSLFSAIYLQGDVVMLAHFVPMDEVAAYGRAFSLCLLASAGYAPVSMYFQSRLARALANEGDAEFRRVANRWSLVGAAAICVGVSAAMAFGTCVLPLVTPVDALTLELMPLVLFGWLLYYLPPYGEMFHFTAQPRVVLVGSSVFAVFNLLLNAIWIPEYGVVGAAWATCLSYILLRSYYISQTMRQARMRLFATTWLAILGGALATAGVIVLLGGRPV